ncbi:MAG: C40 family peptidase [Porphyromonadaceae bacterium]|nr:C40 family peptidase [Porphyromonadaceae bacterium]
MFTIVNNPLIPLRAEENERSEMVSQLLFGQQIEILETTEKWYFVKNLSDNYEGWITKSSINSKFFTTQPADTSDFSAAKTPLLVCFKTSSVEKIIIPGGSMLPPVSREQFELAGEIYQIAQLEPVYTKNDNGQLVVELTQQYTTAPYLWGGKSVLGIDCSGLVQVVFSMLGIFLPRDASQQVEVGTTVDFLSEARPGDLAFFANSEGQIIHVGILINSHQIIHASGSVKKEIIDSQGIISSQTGEYSHTLRVIKRVI